MIKPLLLKVCYKTYEDYFQKDYFFMSGCSLKDNVKYISDSNFLQRDSTDLQTLSSCS